MTVPALKQDDALDFCQSIHRDLYRALLARTAKREVADDLAQETYLRVLENWSKVSQMAHPKGWAFRVGINLAHSRWRKLSREARAITSMGVTGAAQRYEDPSERLGVSRALQALPERQQLAVILRFVGDLSVKEAAQAMGCAEGTVKALTSQALGSLRSAAAVELADDLEGER